MESTCHNCLSLRTINRDIVGGFIITTDGKVLLGNSRKGGVWENQLLVPGGGVEAGETKLDALKREMLEETGIDIEGAEITAIKGQSSNETEKTLKETNERVLVHMDFYDYVIHLKQSADEITPNNDENHFINANWYTKETLKDKDIGPATKKRLQDLGYV
jgi:8-oxo-dGTP pyrophosphatase MutT (NUDIX family)